MFPAAVLTLAILAAPGAEAPKPATNLKDPVCKMAVNEKSPTVTVRGQIYRVCSKHCGAALLKDPDLYLGKDGRPKAAG